MKNLKILETFINEKTPVISRSLFINQKTNSHDKLLLPLKLQLICQYCQFKEYLTCNFYSLNAKVFNPNTFLISYF